MVNCLSCGPAACTTSVKTCLSCAQTSCQLTTDLGLSSAINNTSVVARRTLTQLHRRQSTTTSSTTTTASAVAGLVLCILLAALAIWTQRRKDQKRKRKERALQDQLHRIEEGLGRVVEGGGVSESAEGVYLKGVPPVSVGPTGPADHVGGRRQVDPFAVERMGSRELLVPRVECTGEVHGLYGVRRADDYVHLANPGMRT